MAVLLIYYNIVLPIKHLPLLSDYKNIWHDDYLVVIGGLMSPDDIEREVERLKQLGLNVVKNVGGKEQWDEFCVVSFVDGATLPCPWLECHIDPYNTSYAWLKDQEVGSITKPNGK